MINNKKYSPNAKNGGIVPDLPKTKINGAYVDDIRVTRVPIGCGKCMECMRQKSNSWKVRLMEEIKFNKNGHFVTFTFSNESISNLYERYFADSNLSGYLLDNEIAKKAVRLFLERWRKLNKKSVRHWLVTELGHRGTENIHLHGIIFTDKNASYIRDVWKYGFIWDSTENNGYVSDRTINYITKYVTKVDHHHPNYQPIILCSKGIGASYFNRDDFKRNLYNGSKTHSTYITSTGHEMALPHYYRNKIYSDSERELLWQQMLDNNIRYINGFKIDMNKEPEYVFFDRLNLARELNNRLGYGDDSKNWDKINYENKLRKDKFFLRINNV
jgi:hypothetical protein